MKIDIPLRYLRRWLVMNSHALEHGVTVTIEARHPRASEEIDASIRRGLDGPSQPMTCEALQGASIGEYHIAGIKLIIK